MFPPYLVVYSHCLRKKFDVKPNLYPHLSVCEVHLHTRTHHILKASKYHIAPVEHLTLRLLACVVSGVEWEAEPSEVLSC